MKLTKKDAMLLNSVLHYLDTDDVNKKRKADYTANGINCQYPNIELYEVNLILRYLAKREFLMIQHEENAPPQPKYNYYWITYEGRLFLRNGGFINENKILQQNQNWIIAKTTANAINALAIIILGVLALC